MKKSLIVILVLLSVLFAAVTVLNAQEGGADIPVPESETAGADAAVSDGDGADGPSDAVGLEQPAAEDPSDNEETDQGEEQPAAEDPSDFNNEADPEEEQPEEAADPAADAAAAGAEVTEDKEGMVVHIYGTRVTVELSGEEQAAEGYRIEVTCGELEGEEKDACEAYGREDFRYEGEASVKASEPGTYAMGLAADQFVNENEAFEDVAFVVEEDGCLEITRKDEQPVVTEEPADEDDEEDEGSDGNQNEDPAPTETPADDNTISYGTLTIHLTPETEDNENEGPTVTTTTEEGTATVDGAGPVVTTTEAENTETVDGEGPSVTAVTDETTVTADNEGPAVTTTDEEETATVEGETPAVTTTDEENTETIDDEEPAVTADTDEDTVTADNEEPAITSATEEDTVTAEVEEGAVSITVAENTETAEVEEFEMSASDENAETQTEEGSDDAEGSAEEEAAALTGIAKSGIEVRANADDLSDILFTLEEDTDVTVLAVEGDWLQILLPDGETQGWVLRTGIELPAEETAPEGPAPLTGVVKTGIHVRTDADGMSDILFTLEEDSDVTVLAVEGDWLLVLLPDGETQGWIFHTDIELTAEETEPAEGEPAEEASAPAEKKVTIFTSRRIQMEIGENIVLTSLLEGFEDCEAIKYQWECDKGEGFEAVEGADSDTYTYAATEESVDWSFRLIVFYK